MQCTRLIENEDSKELLRLEPAKLLEKFDLNRALFSKNPALSIS